MNLDAFFDTLSAPMLAITDTYMTEVETEDEQKIKQSKLKTAYNRRVDWQTLIKRMQKTTGCTCKEIAQKTGIKESNVYMIANNSDNWDAGDKAIELIALYLRNTKQPVPMIGDYYDNIEG